jgi:tetrapyrrole methylase family protein/MazG family protein
MKKFDRMLELIEKLRAEGGCPWDKEQTIETLRLKLTEEAKEVETAIDKKDYENLKEELGDVIWTASFLAQISKENGIFSIEQVLEKVIQKMIGRHPHVFGGVKASTSEDAIRLFKEAKDREKNCQ